MGELEVNPYDAPESLIERNVDEDEKAWASEICERHALAARSVRMVSWLNLLIALPFGGLALLAAIVTIANVPIKNMPPIGTRELWIFIFLCAAVCAANFWLWFGLRRFLPWARWIDIALSVLALGNTVRLVLLGLERGAPQGYWIGTVGVPAILALVIFIALISRECRALFASDYKRAFEATRRVRYRPLTDRSNRSFS